VSLNPVKVISKINPHNGHLIYRKNGTAEQWGSEGHLYPMGPWVATLKRKKKKRNVTLPHDTQKLIKITDLNRKGKTVSFQKII
jgi:hypothetical protein